MSGAGKHHRKELTLLEIADRFRDHDDTKAWLVQERRGGTPRCPYRGTDNVPRCTTAAVNATSAPCLV